ncbi:MAG: rod shape-determining protein MreC [Anaerolinea sp.]|nr:rod shape-determining protein MreC [Anaerolinea sp.]
MEKINSRYLKTGFVILIIAGVLLLTLSGYLAPAFNTALKPVIGAQSWISVRYLALRDFLTVPRDVVSLRQRNSELEAEISRLQTQVITYQQQLKEAQVLYALLDFARTSPENQYIASSVIGRDPSPFLHYIIIDHGSDAGIRFGMPVVTQNGLVGTVDAVTAGAARVQLINDPSSIVNILLENSGTEATIAGSVTGEIRVSLLPQGIDVKDGDIILTSGLGGKYPGNILVGQVSSVTKQVNSLFQEATMQAAVDFNNLSVVLVIANFRPLDIQPLIPNP